MPFPLSIKQTILRHCFFFFSAGQRFQPHRRTSGGVWSGLWSPRQLHIPVQTGGVFYFPWHRHQIEGTDGFYCLLRKTLAKRGKRNCQSSEAKRTIDRPVAGRRCNPLRHRPPPTCSMDSWKLLSQCKRQKWNLAQLWTVNALFN